MFKYRLYTLGAVLAFWLLETSIHTWVFHDATFAANLWPSGINEL